MVIRNDRRLFRATDVPEVRSDRMYDCLISFPPTKGQPGCLSRTQHSTVLYLHYCSLTQRIMHRFLHQKPPLALTAKRDFSVQKLLARAARPSPPLVPPRPSRRDVALTFFPVADHCKTDGLSLLKAGATAASDTLAHAMIMTKTRTDYRDES